MMLLCGFACATPPATTDEPTSPPTADSGADPCEVPGVVVGTGQDAYEPLDAGEVLTVVFGPQGGWHVDVGGWVRGMDTIVSVTPDLALDDGVSLTPDAPATTMAMAPAPGCGGVFFGIRAIFSDKVLPTSDRAAFICGLAGRGATLSVEVRDLAGTIAVTDDVEVLLASDPDQVCDP